MAALSQRIKIPSEVRARMANRELDLSLRDLDKVSGSREESERVIKAFRNFELFVEVRSPASGRVQTRDGTNLSFDIKKMIELFHLGFPNTDERESDSLIRSRTIDMAWLKFDRALQRKYGDSRFHRVTGLKKLTIGGKDVFVPAGYGQFSSMPLGKDQLLNFWQYGVVADAELMKTLYGVEGVNLRQFGGATTMFFVLTYSLAMQDALEMGRKGGVNGTILEAEMIGQGATGSDILWTQKRLEVHNSFGARAIMLEMENGNLLSGHLQPRLSPTSQPIVLHMLYRALNLVGADLKATQEIEKDLARALLVSYIDNFDREGFDSKDVDWARQILLGRVNDAKRVLLMPPSQLPNVCELARMDPELLGPQIERDFGNITAHQESVRRVLENRSDLRIAASA